MAMLERSLEQFEAKLRAAAKAAAIPGEMVGGGLHQRTSRWAFGEFHEGVLAWNMTVDLERFSQPPHVIVRIAASRFFIDDDCDIPGHDPRQPHSESTFFLTWSFLSVHKLPKQWLTDRLREAYQSAQ